MKKEKIDNPWLIWFLPIFLSGCGWVLGWEFGPMFYPAPVPIPDSDLYTYDLHRNKVMSLVGIAVGLILAIGIVIQLKRQANIVIPDEQYGHSDDPERDAAQGWQPKFPELLQHDGGSHGDHHSETSTDSGH